jgi:hypothetical protein
MVKRAITKEKEEVRPRGRAVGDDELEVEHSLIARLIIN